MGYDEGFRPRGGRGMGGGPVAPVKEGDEIDVRIEAVGEKGDGIAKKDGFVLFVPNTQEGEVIRIRITKVLRKVGFAEKIGEAQGAPAESAPVEQREAPVEEPEEPAPEDSESFGEEETEEATEDLEVPEPEDAPAEEPAPEAPAEETEEVPAEEPTEELDTPPAPEEETPAEEEDTEKLAEELEKETQ